MERIGELAALATAFCWVGSALFFAAAGERVGSLVVNLVRLVFAIVFLAALTTLTRGQPLPLDASAHAWAWLALSGLVGFAFGDLCLFRAFIDLGP
ncbi:MAG TPA: EamA family transporter, partial [Polyangiaceae bacterium LLY-WYZ-15_(1-7)]|nr:EamA family transporter [Polyangiaceae bacterium LLY-WYZ-15_(1-7)]